jgi:hypothetical protein
VVHLFIGCRSGYIEVRGCLEGIAIITIVNAIVITIVIAIVITFNGYNLLKKRLAELNDIGSRRTWNI